MLTGNSMQSYIFHILVVDAESQFILILFYISLKEYEERAVGLAENPVRLQALSSRLKAARMTCPLFDTKRWVS